MLAVRKQVGVRTQSGNSVVWTTGTLRKGKHFEKIGASQCRANRGPNVKDSGHVTPRSTWHISYWTAAERSMTKPVHAHGHQSARRRQRTCAARLVDRGALLLHAVSIACAEGRRAISSTSAWRQDRVQSREVRWARSSTSTNSDAADRADNRSRPNGGVLHVRHGARARENSRACRTTARSSAASADLLRPAAEAHGTRMRRRTLDFLHAIDLCSTSAHEARAKDGARNPYPRRSRT